MNKVPEDHPDRLAFLVLWDWSENLGYWGHQAVLELKAELVFLALQGRWAKQANEDPEAKRVHKVPKEILE